MELLRGNIRNLIFTILAVGSFLTTEAQESKSTTSLSVFFTQLPFDWVETSVEVPLFQVSNSLKLPHGFSLESSLQTIIVSNQLRSGLRWNHTAGRVSFSAGADVAFLYGKMKLSGFDNSAWGISTFPVISAGYNLKKAKISVVAEYSFLNFLKLKSGTSEISHESNYLSGPSLALYSEELLWKDHMMIIGFINNFHRFYFPAWPAFSTFNRRYYIPQIQIGIIL